MFFPRGDGEGEALLLSSAILFRCLLEIDCELKVVAVECESRPGFLQPVTPPLKIAGSMCAGNGRC